MNEKPLEVVALVAKGDKGEKGEPGLTSAARRAVLVLILLTLALAGANLLWTSHVVNAGHAAQERAGQAVERKLCATLEQLAALRPPTQADVKPGQPYPPSFAYEDQLHVTLAQLGTDVGCKEGKP